MRLSHLNKALILICLSAMAITDGYTQNQKLLSDTVKTKIHSPSKASLMSAVLPGLGQAYNRKYWKVPVVYAGLGTSLYYVFSNRELYLRFRDAYRIRMDDNPNSIDEFSDELLNPEGVFLTEDNLVYSRDKTRRQLEFSVVITLAIYLINIVDAAVDAHLFDFNVSDDLSLNISPIFLSLPANQKHKHYPGFAMRFKF